MTDTPLNTLRKAAERAAGELSIALGYVRDARDRHQADAGHKALIELNKAIHGISAAEPEAASLADAEKDKDLLAARYHELYREHVQVIAERDDRFERAHVDVLNGCIKEQEAEIADLRARLAAAEADRSIRDAEADGRRIVELKAECERLRAVDADNAALRAELATLMEVVAELPDEALGKTGDAKLLRAMRAMSEADKRQHAQSRMDALQAKLAAAEDLLDAATTAAREGGEIVAELKGKLADAESRLALLDSPTLDRSIEREEAAAKAKEVKL